VANPDALLRFLDDRRRADPCCHDETLPLLLSREFPPQGICPPKSFPNPILLSAVCRVSCSDPGGFSSLFLRYKSHGGHIHFPFLRTANHRESSLPFFPLQGSGILRTVHIIFASYSKSSQYAITSRSNVRIFFFCEVGCAPLYRLIPRGSALRKLQLTLSAASFPALSVPRFSLPYSAGSTVSALSLF